MEKGNTDKKVPVIVNIIKKFRRKGINYIISGFCLTKGVNIENIDINKIKAIINEEEYKITFLFKKGIPFIKEFRFNFYKIKIPRKKVKSFDIQSKIELKYENYDYGRIMYSFLDSRNSKYKSSRIYFEGDRSIFLRQTTYNTMCITIRDVKKYDHFIGRIKIELAYIASKFLFNKKIIYLYEKECERYEESASILYEKLIDKGYDNAYFILDKNYKSMDSIKDKYKKNIIYKDSFKHIMYFFKSKTFISSESIDHALELRTANKLVLRKYHSKDLKYVFLQHGVMYMVSLDSELRTGFRKQDYKLHKIVVSSKAEMDHFTSLADFKEEDLYLCGLLKFDRAVRNFNADKIVIMPTWRRWEYNEATYNFENTKYFKMIKRIVRSIPLEYHDRIVILPHPLMVSAIKGNNNFSKYILKDGKKYDDVLKECALLITDYSSIAYDAFYRGANVIFYWEEKEECMQHYKSHLMIDEDTAFGDVVYNTKELESVFEKNYSSSQSIKYRNRFRKIVEFYDNNNTERLIKMLKKDKVI